MRACFAILALSVCLPPAVLACSLDEWACDSAETDCVSPNVICDGVINCLDGSDEVGCSFTWSTGAYAGTSCGVVAFLVICAVVSTVCYRRRYVTVQTTTSVAVVSTPDVTMSRW